MNGACSKRSGRLQSSAKNNSGASDEYYKIYQLESKANELLRVSEKEGLDPQEGDKVHYRASRFQLAPGHSTSFGFSVTSTNTSSSLTFKINEGKTTNQHMNLTGQTIMCTAPLQQIPHFAQTAFPCWSILQLFPEAGRMLEINTPLAEIKSPWIQGILQAFQDAGIQIIDTITKANTTFSLPEWKVQLDPIASGWQVGGGNDTSQFEQGNPYYFLKQSHMQKLQQIVLGKNFSRITSLPIEVLLLERKGYSREWIYANQTASDIKSIWDDDLINVKVLPNPEGSLQQQADEFHRANIIISPHGAQLTNLAFIRPCTIVLEFFPVQYYVAFFQPYVLSADAIHFDGYPFMREPLYDSKETGHVGPYVRGQLRGKHILASPESVLRAFPRLVLNHLSCQKSLQQWD